MQALARARGFEAKPCAEVVGELAEAEAVEHSELLSNRWGYRGLNAVNDLSCDGNRKFKERPGISSDVSLASYLVIVFA